MSPITPWQMSLLARRRLGNDLVLATTGKTVDGFSRKQLLEVLQTQTVVRPTNVSRQDKDTLVEFIERWVTSGREGEAILAALKALAPSDVTEDVSVEYSFQYRNHASPEWSHHAQFRTFNVDQPASREEAREALAEMVKTWVPGSQLRLVETTIRCSATDVFGTFNPVREKASA